MRAAIVMSVLLTACAIELNQAPGDVTTGGRPGEQGANGGTHSAGRESGGRTGSGTAGAAEPAGAPSWRVGMGSRRAPRDPVEAGAGGSPGVAGAGGFVAGRSSGGGVAGEGPRTCEIVSQGTTYDCLEYASGRNYCNEQRECVACPDEQSLDCNRDGRDGCEAHKGSNANCGSCNTPCTLPGTVCNGETVVLPDGPHTVYRCGAP